MLRLLSTFLRTFSCPPLAGSQPCPGLLLTEPVIPNASPACLSKSHTPHSTSPHVMPTCPWLSHASCWCSHTMPPPTGRAMPPMPVAVRCLMPAPELRILASGIKHPIPPPVPGNQDVAGEFVKICIFDLAVWETELS